MGPASRAHRRLLPGQEEEEEEEEEASTSSNLLSAFAAAPKATPFFVCLFTDFWYDFSGGVTCLAACGSSGAGLPTHCVWTTGFYSTEPITCWIVLFSCSFR